MPPLASSSHREGTSALLVRTDERLLLQMCDNLPHVTDPGKISLFGGRREGDEICLECVVREIHEEIGYYLPPERFELIGSYSGPDHSTSNGTPVDELTVTEGRLEIVTIDELENIRDMLAPPAKIALEIFLKR